MVIKETRALRDEIVALRAGLSAESTSPVCSAETILLAMNTELSRSAEAQVVLNSELESAREKGMKSCQALFDELQRLVSESSSMAIRLESMRK